MNRIVSIVGAAALAGAVSLPAISPAAAQPWPYYRYHHHYYGHGGWYGPGPAIGAGILGFAAGAAIAGAASENRYGGYGWRAHVAACEDNYRSYDVRSDTYLGYDGLRHRCLL